MHSYYLKFINIFWYSPIAGKLHIYINIQKPLNIYVYFYFPTFTLHIKIDMLMYNKIFYIENVIKCLKDKDTENEMNGPIKYCS